MGSSSAEDTGGGNSDCIPTWGVTVCCIDGVSRVTDRGGDHDGVAAGTFCEDTKGGKTGCGVGCSKASERQRTRGLRTGAYTEFGNTGISDVSGSSAMASGIDSSGTGTGVIGTSFLTWKDLHTEEHETHQAD